MAVNQVVPISILLEGDGVSTTFNFFLGYVYQIASGSPVNYGNLGTIPTSIVVTSPPVPISSATIDAFGNITITTMTPIGAGVILNFGLNLMFPSGDTSTFPVAVPTGGALTNNIAAPNSSNLGVLPAIASAAAPTYGQGNQVLLSTDLAGNLRVTGTFFPATQPVSGTVAISNFPATQPVSGTVAVTQSTSPWVVSGTITANAGTGTFTVGGTVAVSNFPATQPVSGTVAVSNFPAVQASNQTEVNGVALVTSAAGVQKVGIVGNAGAILDTPIGANTAAANALQTASVYQTTVPALTAGQAVATQCDTTGAVYVDTEGRKNTYSAVAYGTISGPGDFAVIQGSASKTIRVVAIEVSFSTTGAAAFEVVELIRGNGAPTGGTHTNPTVALFDPNYPAATATIYAYSVPPTGGVVGVANIKIAYFLDAPVSSTAVQPAFFRWTFGTEGGSSAVVLRGTTDCLALNLAGIVGTQSYAISVEWVEDNS